MEITEKSLTDEFGYWNEHPEYPLGRWEYAVRNRRTRQSYWSWVANQLDIATTMAEGVPTEESVGEETCTEN